MPSPRWLLLFIAFAALGFGCVPSDEARARYAVRASQRDPESVRFGSFVRVGKKHACLTVILRNSLYRSAPEWQAFLTREQDSWRVAGNVTTDQATCIEVQRRTEER